MAVELTTIEIETRLKGVEQAVAGLNGLKSAGSGAEMSFGQLAGKIAGFTSMANLAVQVGQKVVSTIVDLGKESVVLAADFEKSRITWGVLVGDMNKGADLFKQLQQFANATPLSFQAVNQAATTLKGFGIQTADLIPTMSKLGDVAMGDNNKLQSLALVYGQVAAQGKAKTQDLYQFINAGVPIFNLLAESMQQPLGAIKDLAADGKITFSEIEKAIKKATDEGGQFYDMMDKTAQSAEGKWSTAQDNFKAQLAALGETVLPMVTKALDEANREMERWNKARGAAAAVQQELSLPNLVSNANIAGVRSFIQGLNGVNPDEVQGWIDLARKSNPLATSGQAAALRAAEQELLAYRARFAASQNNPPAPAPSATPGYDDFLSGYRGFVLDESKFDIRGGPIYPRTTPSESTVQDATDLYANRIADVQTLDSLTRAEEQWNKAAAAAERYDRAIEAGNAALVSSAESGFVDTFKNLGDAFASGADGATSLANSIADIGKSILNEMPLLLFQAGIAAIGKGDTATGLALIAASGITSIGAGLANSGASSSSSGGTAYENALGGVYRSPSLSRYSGGIYDTPHFFTFAKGGVFGEAGAEAIMPLSRTASGALGVRAEGAGGGTTFQIIDQTSKAVKISTEETVGADGAKTIRATLSDIVKSVAASGELDSALASRYGMSVAGRRVK